MYKTETNQEGKIEKLKAGMVVKGYKQRQRIDYGEVFAHVARIDTIRLQMALAAQNEQTLFQVDVKPAFMNDYLEEEVYFEQPLDLCTQEDKAYRLQKALYALKQAPQA